MGDVNFDGVVDDKDAVLIVKHVSGTKELTTSQLNYADVKVDGKVDILDAIAILNK